MNGTELQAGAAGATLRLLQAQVAEIRKKDRTRSIGFHVAGPWIGGEVLPVEGEVLPLAWCPSALAFRDELVRHERAGRQAVLLTDRQDQELGLDVLARLVKRRLFRPDAFQALSERLGVRDVDPRLRKYRWLPDHLLEVWTGDVRRPASPVLDADEVWEVLLGHLGFPDPRPDLRALLAWTIEAGGPARLADLPPEVRAAYADRLALSAGEAGVAVLRLVGGPHPRPLSRERERGEQQEAQAVAAGLVCEVLFASGAAADRAVGRFEERLLGGVVLDVEAGRAWAAAASELVRERRERHGEAAVAPWLAQAGELFAQLNIEALAERSSWLPAGFARRSGDFAETLNAWLDQLETARPEVARLEALAAAAQRVREHGLAPGREAEMGAVEMMVRLSRWLGVSRLRRDPHPPAPSPTRTHARPGEGESLAGSFEEAVGAYVREGSFVDLGRTALADAPLSGSLAAARDRLFRVVTAQRESENRRFAELLAGWSAGGGEDAEIIPLESVLDRVVTPLAAAGPVLLLVLDGLSFPVFRELASGLARRGWEELRPEGAAARLCGIGLFPTITELCRTSLLCGARRKGNADTEKQGFDAHPGLRRQGTAARPPLLFHKKDLTGGGLGLAPAVRSAIEESTRRVVGIVLNVVDDQLPKGGQLLPRWEVGALRYLEEILEMARATDRTVVITADHGHVIERETELRRHEGGGARYRPARPAGAGEGEILSRGPRVLTDDGQVILAWSERLRYATIAGGYHGGASPQEVIVPLSVWVPFEKTLDGWEPGENDVPAWWEGETAPPAPAARPSRPTGKSRLRSVPSGQGVLFAAPPIDWLDALFAAPVYKEQLRQFGSRQGITDDSVRSVLQALDQRGKLTLAALSHQLGLTVARGQLLVAALQRVLNVDGFGVLSFEPESGSVILDRGLLEAQFLRGGEE